MTERVFNVRFLCTGNSARSVVAEAILNRTGKGRFKAYSAGSHPQGQINPFALELLERHNFPVSELRSKPWDEFAVPDAQELDFVITVCDNAAGEVCPVWSGRPMTAHWGIADPAAVGGAVEQKRKAFVQAFDQLSRRISRFASLPLVTLDAISLKRELDAIGHLRDHGDSE
jgi:arsenate reductase